MRAPSPRVGAANSMLGMRHPLRFESFQRRCALSSITTFERAAATAEEDGAAPGHRLVEVGYVEPAASLQVAATDVGAV